MEGVARAVDHGLEELVPGPGGRRQPEELVQRPELLRVVARRGVVRGRARVVLAGGSRVRLSRRRPRRGGAVGRRGAKRCGPSSVPEHRHGEHDTSLGGVATEVGCGVVPGRCPWSRTVTLGGWQPGCRSRILTPWPRIPPGLAGPPDRRRARASPPSRPSRRALASGVPGTRWRARCGCSARSSARSSRSRPARSCSSSSSASGGARSPCDAATPRSSRHPTRSARGWPTRSARSTSTRRRPSPGRSRSTSSSSTSRRSGSGSASCARRARAARGGPIDDSIAEAIARLLPIHGADGVRALVADVVVHPVLTAHPTEARRRTLLVALRRIRRLLDELDDPLTDPRRGRRPPPPAARGDHDPVAHGRAAGGDADAARRGAHCARVLRRDAVHGRARVFGARRPGARRRGRGGRAPREPAVSQAARLRRRRGAHRDPSAVVPAFLRLGSWIGADRDGNPDVTRRHHAPRRCASRPTTCSAATRPSRRG